MILAIEFLLFTLLTNKWLSIIINIVLFQVQYNDKETF